MLPMVHFWRESRRNAAYPSARLSSFCRSCDEMGSHVVMEIFNWSFTVFMAHIPSMQQVLAEVMGIDADDISIKATTTEKLGFTGREEGISAYATVLINRV